MHHETLGPKAITMNAKNSFTIVIVCLLFATTAVRSESRWVSDQFEVMLRSGPSTGNEIKLMVDSGTELDVIDRDADSGYSRVRTAGGTEGWVLTRYLMAEPSAREQLQKLTSQLTDASTQGASLNSQLLAVRDQYSKAERRIATLEKEKAKVEKDLAEIRRTAANVLSINDQNKDLREQLMASGIEVDTLQQENRELGGQSKRYWFMSGALVLVIGIVLGLWLPRIRWQRRSRYDRF